MPITSLVIIRSPSLDYRSKALGRKGASQSMPGRVVDRCVEVVEGAQSRGDSRAKSKDPAINRTPEQGNISPR